MTCFLFMGEVRGDFDPAVLQSQWVDAFKRGAQNLGRPFPSGVSVSFPFYGDALDQFANAASLPLTSDIQIRGAAPNNAFLAFQDQIVEDLRAKAGVTDQEVLDEYGANPQERGPLNWAWVQSIFAPSTSMPAV